MVSWLRLTGDFFLAAVAGVTIAGSFEVLESGVFGFSSPSQARPSPREARKILKALESCGRNRCREK
jgi:hypothetical protein